MPVTRELSIAYGSFTVGGSTARQIDGFTMVERDYEASAVEFSFITSATTAAAFATEVDAVEDAFRIPRQNLTITQESQTLLSLSHTGNTGFNAAPRIIKQGDVGDTGRSRHYTVRIDFGMPADNVSTSFRRTSTVKIEYDPSRRRTVTINATYTANTDGTAALAQYRATISTYGTSVLNVIDSTATWELIGEPDVTYDDQNKVCDAVAVYREIIFNQSSGGLDEADIVDPSLTFAREKTAPGDSEQGALTLGSGGSSSPLTTSGTVDTVAMSYVPGQDTVNAANSNRPIVFTAIFSCSVNKENTTDLRAKWSSVIRPFIITQAAIWAEAGVVLITERPDFDPHWNRFTATMLFHAYSSGVKLKLRIKVSDNLNSGRVLHGVYSPDPYDYYEHPGPAVRIRTVTEEYEEIASETNPHSIAEGLQWSPGAIPAGLANAEKWMLLYRTPSPVTLKRGLPGADQPTIAEVTIETALQFRNKRTASVANVGGVTGAGLTG